MSIDLSIINNKSNATEAYVVLARRYRPAKFCDLIGHDVLVRIISNAIKVGKVPHAFILTGTRGVGKTTVARLLAKVLNCNNAIQNGENVEPCDTCSSCIGIAAGTYGDVHEIDAASNTGVNDVRELKTDMQYMISGGKYKIYIIDEVHMLSNSAFNALLKMLEEPPHYVKFILATTEIHKIPATILSRCQKFDLKRVALEKLTDHYINIVKIEGYQTEQRAIKLIAMAAAGSVRDGLSILEQALSYITKGDCLTEEHVRQMLYMASDSAILEIISSLIGKDQISVLQILERAYEEGMDPVICINAILETLHKITKVKVAGIRAVSDETDRAVIKNIADSAELSIFFRLWQIISNGYDVVKKSTNQQAALEMLLMRCVYTNKLPSLESVLLDTQLDTQSETSNTNLQHQHNLSVSIESLKDICALCIEHNDIVLADIIRNNVHLISINGESIVIRLTPDVSNKAECLEMLKCALHNYTNKKWTVILDQEPASKDSTLRAKEVVIEKQLAEQASKSNEINAVLSEIDGLSISHIEFNSSVISSKCEG